MTNRADRTLTAVQSPLAQGETKDRGVLLMVGSAESPGLPAKTRLQILGEELVVGRRTPDETRPGSHALVLNDSVVSGQHARLVRAAAGGWEVEDLGSKNGTWVDNERLTEKTKLRDGALLFFGNHVGVFGWPRRSRSRP
jgi:pSer/pThr/pTyr-binding forkhead associated (FHA) protein